MNSNIKILVAEDNDLNSKLMAAVLSPDMFTPVFVTDGAEAIAACEAEDFHIILMDLRMPEVDGFEAAKTIRKEGARNQATPIIAITADAVMGQKEKCEAAGMNGYFTKPVSPAELKHAILEMVSGA